MRLPYIDPADPKAFTTPEEKAIVARVRDRRAPRPLQPLDLTLLHSPAVADGWNSFLGAIRTKTSLPDDVREVAICRVAVINQAWYEWAHHAPLAKAGGVSEQALALLEQPDLGGKKGSEVLNQKLWAVVDYTDAMTRDVAVKDGVFQKLREHFSEQEAVEVTATVSSPNATFDARQIVGKCMLIHMLQVAAYNCVSRFLVALDGKLICHSRMTIRC
jgi:alkylhydroperoxidase family enzyme